MWRLCLTEAQYLTGLLTVQAGMHNLLLPPTWLFHPLQRCPGPGPHPLSGTLVSECKRSKPVLHTWAKGLLLWATLVSPGKWWVWFLCSIPVIMQGPFRIWPFNENPSVFIRPSFHMFMFPMFFHCNFGCIWLGNWLHLIRQLDVGGVGNLV